MVNHDTSLNKSIANPEPGSTNNSTSPGEDGMSAPMRAVDLHATIEKFFNIPIKDFLSNDYAGQFITDEHDLLIWMNEVVREHPSIGHDIPVILGRHTLQVLQYLKEFVRHAPSFVEMTKELLKKKKLYMGYEFQMKDGRSMNLDFYPVYTRDTYKGAIWQLTELNPHHAQGPEKNEGESLTGVLDKFQLPYCEIDLDGHIYYASDSFSRLTGYPQVKLSEKNVFDLCASGKENLKNWIRKNLFNVSKHAAVPIELEIILQNGNRFWTSCHVTFTRDRQECVTIIKLLFTDITEQKNIQKDLEYARQVTEHAQRTQQQFLASMSHDIRTPLNAIIGMVFLLQDTKLDANQKEYIKVLKNSSNILLGMLNGVLDFAKIESGKQEVHQREIDLPGLINSITEALSYRLANKPVKLASYIDKEINQILIGDDILLNQILMNLLGNAEKFTTKGEITIEVNVVKRFDTTVWIEFKVKDTGIGISKSKQQEIFQDFTQADADIGVTYGGSGLGLFICKKLVDVLGGQISLESTPGRGTVFSFSIPFTVTDQLLKNRDEAAMTTYSFKDSDDIRLLVVEDNPMNLKYLSSLLGKYALNFDIATNGKAALEKASKTYYNLILMDMKLPGMNGMEVARRIREEDLPNTATPIVLVSAAAFQSTVDSAKEAGVNELLTKPYTPNQLLDILLKYLVEEEDDESGIVMPTSTANGFKFDERLDTAYLEKLYSGNCTYAISLFEVFIDCMAKDWDDIQQAIDNNDLISLKNLVHKVKPNFSMVGLSWITEMMQDVYNHLKHDDNEKALALLVDVHVELERFMPLVKEELVRMENYVGSSISDTGG